MHLSVELIQRSLLREEEARAKAVLLKQSSNKKMKQVTPTDLGGKLTQIKLKQIDGPSHEKPTEDKGKPSIPQAERADKIMDKIGKHPTTKNGPAGNSPNAPKVDRMAKPNQSTHTKEVSSTPKHTADGGGSNKQFFSKAPDASSIMDEVGHGGIMSGSDDTPEVKAPKAAKTPGSTPTTRPPKPREVKADMNRMPKDKASDMGKPDADMKRPSDAPGRQTWKKETYGASNIVESGVIVKLGNKQKAVFGVVSRAVLNRMVENYRHHGYEVTLERTNNIAWKRDRRFLRLLHESIDAKHNFVPSQHSNLRKAALNRFSRLVAGDFNSLYESRNAFLKTVLTAFKKIERVAEAKYKAGLEIFEAVSRITGTNVGDLEVITEATDHQMALRQIRNSIMEAYGLGTKIVHIIVDGKKYTPGRIRPWICEGPPPDMMVGQRQHFDDPATAGVDDLIQRSQDLVNAPQPDDSALIGNAQAAIAASRAGRGAPPRNTVGAAVGGTRMKNPLMPETRRPRRR